MASKKNKTELSYLQMPLPESRKSFRTKKRSWAGLNYKQTIDTGALSMERNISTIEAPYLTPSKKWEEYLSGYYSKDVSPLKKPISMFGFDDFLLVVYNHYNANPEEEEATVRIDYIKENENGSKLVYTGVLNDRDEAKDDMKPRSIVQFNVYDTPTDTLTGKYIKKLLIYPDCKSINFEITEDDVTKTTTAIGTESITEYIFQTSDMNAEVIAYTNDEEPYLPPSDAVKYKYYKNTYNNDIYRWVEDEEDENNSGWKISVPPGGPKLNYVTVHLSRLFGVDDDRVYVSGYNDYTNWNLDTADEYNESNAWCSPAQSNTKAGGSFTGITTFQNHVVCFKRDFMHEIYNTKNPFRIQDIYAEGTIDNRTIQDVDGKLIFVSADNVKIYTGGDPRIISYNLGIDNYDEAVSGTDNRCYYLYCKNGTEKRLFVYDTFVGEWSEQSVDSAVISFAHNKNGMFALCADGVIYQLNAETYADEWSFETDLITNQTVDIKHIRKIQMFADIAPGASIKVYILYDDEVFNADASHLVYESTDYGKKPIRVKPRQTAHYGFKLHIEGSGYVKLYELEITFEAGGDLYA